MSLTHNISHHPGRVAATKELDVAHEILRTVEELKRGSGFGSVEIVLHEGRVTQIEKREKLRFNHSSNHDSQKK
jgi:hypothetical protein